ncbi:T4 RnlA family RNA ligase [Zavarzinella formosa]|uniref:T4 RnlA family RNA ligase n=1 Tax=Zavarzinella formosa TaxID=360055 RepID=UPI0003649BA5|nr:T4 RnlA family RNA ligase [Zavarzinella formosa]
MRHPARTMPFDQLWDGLQKAVADKRVKENVGQDGLRLYCYSESTVYERAWDDVTMLARGVILDPVAKRVVATPFPKFFNVGERLDSVPDLHFETFEKLDGSLIILFHHNGEWRCATKGSLGSDQAKWAMKWIVGHDLSVLDRDTTYLAEAIYPENRIVVHYADSGLFLLAAYHGDGSEMNYADLRETGERLGWAVAKRHGYESISELLALAKTLPPSKEGFVLRFANGLRLKVKGDEYCRIHRLVSGLSPLAMWEAMQAGDDLNVLRRQLPEEFWSDFDLITAILRQQADDLIEAVSIEAVAVSHLSDKEVGLRLAEFPDDVRRFIFPFRKTGGDLLSGRTKDLVYRSIRPDGNRLAGYVPSSAMSRVFESAI